MDTPTLQRVADNLQKALNWELKDPKEVEWLRRLVQTVDDAVEGRDLEAEFRAELDNVLSPFAKKQAKRDELATAVLRLMVARLGLTVDQIARINK